MTWDHAAQGMLVEAYLYLAWARILKTTSFSKMSRVLGRHMEETTLQNDPAQLRILKQVSSVIQITSRYTWWESACLVRAAAAMKMLERRRINSTIYLGTSKDEQGKFIAHAWLRSGSFYVTGAEVMNQFKVVSSFAKYAAENSKGE